MKKALFYISTALIFSGALALAKTTLPCTSGGICVAVQESDEGTKVTFNDFVHIDDIDGYYMRIVEEKEGLSGETQMAGALAIVSEADPSLAREMQAAVEEVEHKSYSSRSKPGKSTAKKGTWARQTLALFNSSAKKFVIDMDLFKKLKETDSAGATFNMGCVKVASDRKIPSYQFVNCERLTRRAFCDDECYKAVAEYTKSPAPTYDQRKAKIKYLLGMFVPPKESSPLAQNIAPTTPTLHPSSAASRASVSTPPLTAVAQPIPPAQTNPPVINNMPPVPAPGPNPWIAPQYQQPPANGSDVQGPQAIGTDTSQQQQPVPLPDPSGAMAVPAGQQVEQTQPPTTGT